MSLVSPVPSSPLPVLPSSLIDSEAIPVVGEVLPDGSISLYGQMRFLIVAEPAERKPKPAAKTGWRAVYHAAACRKYPRRGRVGQGGRYGS